MTKRILIVLSFLLLAWILNGVIRFMVFSARGGVLIQAAKPYERSAQTGKKLLVLGDSLAYGTGASSPETSIAGRVAGAYPDMAVENRSKNGKRTNELAQEITTLGGHYNVILIVIGGNDAMRPWINLDVSGQNLKTIYRAASQHADKVIAFSTGNMRTTTFFPWPVNNLVGQRSVILRNHAITAAKDLPNVHYIDMVAYNETAPFTGKDEAPDHLHLNDSGTLYWFDALKAKGVL